MTEQNSQWPLWEVFVQPELGEPHVHAGSVHAPDPEMALQNARDVYARRWAPKNIWIVRSEHIVATTPAESGPFFDPADDKAYRHPQFYKVPKRMRCE